MQRSKKTEVLAQAQYACRENGLTLRDESELIQEIAKPGRSGVSWFGARGWGVPSFGDFLPDEGRIIPDRMFAIEFPHLPPGENRLYFFLESDRGTESQVSKNYKRPTIARKMRQYRVTAKRRVLQEHFPAIKSFVVLFVPTKKERADNMYKNNRAIEGGWKNFWFAPIGVIEEMPFFSVAWKTGKDGSELTLDALIRRLLGAGEGTGDEKVLW